MNVSKGWAADVAFADQRVDLPFMAGIVTLDDGSEIYVSNMGLGGTLECVAEAVSALDPQFARWLSDVAQRGGGFMDFDLRGLNPERRALFWRAIEQSNARYGEWDQAASFSPTVGVIRLFYERRGVQTATAQGTPQIDLDELWFA